MDEEYYHWIHSSDFTESDARDEGYRAYQNGSRSSDTTRSTTTTNGNFTWLGMKDGAAPPGMISG